MINTTGTTQATTTTVVTAEDIKSGKATITGVSISNGLVEVITAGGMVLTGHDHTGEGNGYTCLCGAHYPKTEQILQHTGYYCPRLFA